MQVTRTLNQSRVSFVVVMFSSFSSLREKTRNVLFTTFSFRVSSTTPDIHHINKRLQCVYDDEYMRGYIFFILDELQG